MERRRRCAGLVLAAWLLALPVAANDLAGQAAAIDAPGVGGVLRVEGPLRFGRAELTPEAGTTVRALQAGGERCGVLVTGPSGLRYTVDDAVSAPVAARNVKRVLGGGVAPTDGSAFELRRPVLEAVLWGWGFGDLEVAAEADAGALPEWAVQALDQPFFSHPSLELLHARANGGEGLVYALLRTSGEILLAVHDPALTRSEGLFALDRVKVVGSVDRGRRYAVPLAVQPAGRSWQDQRPAALVATATALDVDNPRGAEVVVRSRSRLQGVRPARLWRVDLRTRRVENNSEIPIAVREVTVGGKPAAWLHLDNELLVDLGRTIRTNDVVEVEVVSAGGMAVRYGGDSFWSLGTWAWYPQPDFDGELATMTLRVRVPEPFTPFASGATVSRRSQDGYAVLETVLDKPSQFPVVAAGKYETYSDTRDGRTCTVATYAGGKKGPAEQQLSNFFAAVQFYELLFGQPYPFSELTVVEVNSWGFGQAPPGIIFITKEAFQPTASEASKLFSGGVNGRYVHEIAHAWWGHHLKMISAEEQWLSESLAEYSSALCLEAMRGGGKKGRREFDAMLQEWTLQTRWIGDGGSIYLANYLTGDSDDGDARYALLYAKGPLVLHALRLELRRIAGGDDRGDELFFTALRSLLASFPYRWGETRHLIGILNQITGQDWQPFFDRYVFGTEMPVL